MRFGDSWAIRDVDLAVEAGERVAIVGPSGAGKTTLLSAISGATPLTEGTATLMGRDLSRAAGRAREALLAKVGTVRQQFDLVGPLRVVHNVNAGRLARWSLLRAVVSLAFPCEIPDTRRILARVGIADKLFERTDRLSGGEQQRVAIARVLAQNPDIILADEPVASLDPARGADIMQLLGGLAQQSNKTLVVSLHNFRLALSGCERVVGLRSGRVLFDLPAQDVTEEMAARLYRIEDAPR